MIKKVCDVFAIAFLLLAACESSAGAQQSNTSRAVTPQTIQQIVEVENEIEVDQHKMSSEARALLKNRKYAELDAFIDKLCASKKRYPNGRWNVDLLYMEFCDPPGGDKNSTDQAWQDLIADLKGWATARPQSANARIALAEAYVGYAWNARGGGFSGSVTDEGWKLMDKRLKVADQYLKQCDKLTSKNPRKWAVAQLIGLGSSMPKNQYQEIVDAALKSEPTYETVLFERCNFLLPRWHGEQGEWEDEAVKSADQLKGDEADKRYARIMWSASSLSAGRDLFKNSKADYGRVKRGFLLLLKENPDSLAVTSRFCVLSVCGADQVQARELFKKLNGRMTKSAWRTKKYFKECRDWANAS